MKSIFLIILIPIVFFSCNNVQQVENRTTELNHYPGLDSTESLIEKTFFDKIILKIPSSFSSRGNTSTGNAFDIISFENHDGTVNMTIRKKEAVPFEMLKEIHESMATSFYKGTIHRSETIVNNGVEIYVFDMTGYWNGAEVKESWMKFFTTDGDDLYQCLIRFPEKDRLSTLKLREEILQSLALEIK